MKGNHNKQRYKAITVGQNFDDVYSDLVKKTKPRYRHLLDEYINWDVRTPIGYDKDGVPHIVKHTYRSRLAYNMIFINKEGVLEYHETLEDLLIFYKNKMRENKLKKLLLEDFFIELVLV